MKAQETVDIPALLDEHESQSGAVAALSLACHSMRAIRSVMPTSDSIARSELQDAIDQAAAVRQLFKSRMDMTAAKIRTAMEVAK